MNTCTLDYRNGKYQSRQKATHSKMVVIYLNAGSTRIDIVYTMKWMGANIAGVHSKNNTHFNSIKKNENEYEKRQPMIIMVLFIERSSRSSQHFYPNNK